MSKTRRNHAPQFKAKVALEALAGEKTIGRAAYNVHEIAAKHQVHPNQVTQWRRQLIDQAAEVFGKPAGKAPADDCEARESGGSGLILGHCVGVCVRVLGVPAWLRVSPEPARKGYRSRNHSIPSGA